MQSLFAPLFIAIYGLAVGSFLNVCIYRIPLNQSVARGRSYCPRCGSGIPWYRNIPLLSYLLLKGRCRDCKEPISAIYPVVESLNALLWLLAWFRFGSTPEALLAAALASLLLVVALIDFRHQIIPDGLVLFLLLLGGGNALYGILVLQQPWSLWAIGFFAASLPLYGMGLLYPEGMGGGDIKLMAAAGLFLGWKNILLALFLGALYALPYAAVLLLRGNSARHTSIPFGPFLSLGILTALFAGDLIIALYLSLIF